MDELTFQRVLYAVLSTGLCTPLVTTPAPITPPRATVVAATEAVAVAAAAETDAGARLRAVTVARRDAVTKEFMIAVRINACKGQRVGKDAMMIGRPGIGSMGSIHGL